MAATAFPAWWIPATAGVLLPLLLFFEQRVWRRGMVPVKTLLSALFVLAAVTVPHPDPAYARLVVAALGFSLAGDVFLALGSGRTFMAGLLAFLTGHLFYVAGFAHLTTVNPWLAGGAVAAAAAAGAVFRWLRPHLGSMVVPVVVYIVVISAMTAGACGVFGTPAHPPAARALVLAGALLFFVSDIFVARDRFVRKQFANRLFGLPLYYAGQFLLAYSVGQF